MKQTLYSVWTRGSCVGRLLLLRLHLLSSTADLHMQCSMYLSCDLVVA